MKVRESLPGGFIPALALFAMTVGACSASPANELFDPPPPSKMPGGRGGAAPSVDGGAGQEDGHSRRGADAQNEVGASAADAERGDTSSGREDADPSGSGGSGGSTPGS